MPKIVDKKEKRAEILKAAVRVFAKTGLPKTKMMTIAEEAGIGKGTIYEYFKSKEELFIAAFEAFVEQSNAQVARRLRWIDDPVKKLRAYFDAWNDILEGEFLDFADIILDFWAEGLRTKKTKATWNLNKMYSEYRIQIIQILQEGIRQKKFKPVDTTIASSIIIGTLDGLMVQWIMDRDLFRFSEAVEQLANIIIDGLTEGS
ncbi:MAG: TetR/AcrR family transcriptional regulator [bacterium]